METYYVTIQFILCNKFKAYLWGMETTINSTENNKITLFKAYLWGMETLTFVGYAARMTTV